ncbi:MAG: signal peptidase I [Proteobacteria bacterium]|nr:signal peptidase I [Pseudomonadota bacterium]MBU1715551.1 signal peptidase I [Pseudomonadota bacterium]
MTNKNSNADKPKSIVREYVEAILIALFLAFFIRTFVVQAFKIPSGSMIPTLLVGDHILVNKFIYGIKNPFNGNTWLSLSEPQRKDIIVFKYPLNPSQDFIKRVVGVAGDRIEIVNKILYVNGKIFEVENAVHLDDNIIPPGNDQSERDNLGLVVVPEHSLFVMGDNRDNSHDSRFWKFVDLKAVKGKAFIFYWSWDSDDFSVRWSRIGDMIH